MTKERKKQILEDSAKLVQTVKDRHLSNSLNADVATAILLGHIVELLADKATTKPTD